MRILAIETSGRVASLALLTAENDSATLIREISLEPDQRTAQALAPAMSELFRAENWFPADLDLVAVAIGPGSFTGLRIGVTAAKMLAYSVEAQLVAVDTLDVLAAQVSESNATLWTILDAQRGELFAASYCLSQTSSPTKQGPNKVLGNADWLAQLNEDDLATGPILSRLIDQLPPGVRPVDKALWHPTACAVGQVAWQRYLAGQRDDPWQLVPVYGRLSAAEEKLLHD